MKRGLAVFAAAAVLSFAAPTAGATGNSLLTREQFAIELASAAEYQPVQTPFPALPPDISPSDPNAPVLEALMQAGVLKGFPDGRIEPSAPITYLQAMAMVGRALDLPEDASAPNVTPPGLSPDHWGYDIFSWISQQGLGLDNVSPNAYLTVEQGKEIISQVFGTDAEALAMVEANAEAHSNIHTMTADISSAIEAVPSAVYAAKFPQMPSTLKATSTGVLKAVMPDQFEAQMTTTTQAPGPKGPQTVTVSSEMYVVPQGVYVGGMVPGKGELWLKMPEDVSSIFRKMEQQNTMPIPPSLQKEFHYRLIGQKTVNGEVANVVAFYGRVNDIASLLPPQDSNLIPSNLMGALGPISFHGVILVGAKDSLTLGADMVETVASKEGPLSLMTNETRISNVAYNQSVTITLPPAAANAVTIPSNPSAGGTPALGPQG